MSEIEVKIRDDKAMLYTPYNPEFVKRIKKFSDARWNSGEKCWTIDESNLGAARVIMKEIYGYADNEINEKVTLKIHVKESVSKKHGDVILIRKNESFDEPDEFPNDPIEVVKTTRVVKEWVAKSDQYNFDPVLLKEQKAKLQKYLKKIDCILDILEMEKMDY